jgi:hypothetical protein
MGPGELVVAIGGIVVFVLAGWWGFGQIIARKENPPALPAKQEEEDKCAQCERDKAYFNSQPWWKQAALAVWYAGNRVYCTLIGC